MSKLKHTKGPWISSPACYGDDKDALIVDDEFDIFTEDGKILGYVGSKYDARLISCVPEMLEALIELRQTIEHPDYTWNEDDWRTILNNLIERATGLSIKEILE